MIISVTKLFEFEAAHHLTGYDGLCRNLHGHTYKLEVEMTGWTNKEGFVFDFAKLKKLVKDEIVDKWDHSNLNDFFNIPTAEMMVEYIVLTLDNHSTSSLYLSRVRLWETSTSYAEWRKEC